jgi:hypothetical protein
MPTPTSRRATTKQTTPAKRSNGPRACCRGYRAEPCAYSEQLPAADFLAVAAGYGH